MATSEGEAVADVLDQLDGDVMDWCKLRDVVALGPDPEMGYEDWVRPMKLTGGRVCLRVEGPGWQRPGFYHWTPAGMKMWDSGTVAGVGAVAVKFLKRDVTDLPSHVTPVLREDTPFGEVED